MTGPVLTEEKLDRYEPLGAFGQPVYQNHVQLQAALRQRLGARYADFFAIPRLDNATGTVSWQSPVAGEARRWADLPPDEQAARALDLQVMKSEFQTYLDELKAYEQQGDQPRGARAFMAVLEQALRSPNDGHLFFVGDQPVVTFWGFREEEAPPFETLSAAPSVRAAAPFAATPARDLRWLWWLLPLLLLLLALLVWWFWPDDPAVDPFANEATIEEELTDPPGKDDPLLPEDEDTPPEPDRRGVIVDGDRVIVPGESVEGEMVEGDGAVAVPEGEGALDADAPAPPDTPEGQGADPEASEQPEGSEDQAQPETPEPPGPEEPTEQPDAPEPPAPEDKQAQPEQPAPDPGAPPAIPEDAQDGAAGFMEGRWKSDSGLIDSRTRQKLDQEYRFGKDGKGETILRREDGTTCRAPATATMKGGNLEVEETENLKCTDGSTFSRSRTVCRPGPGGKTECVGTDADGDRFRVDINRGQQP